MEREMKVTIGVVITEEEVKKYIKSYGGDPNDIDDLDWWIECAEAKYSQGFGAEASFCN